MSAPVGTWTTSASRRRESGAGCCEQDGPPQPGDRAETTRMALMGDKAGDGPASQRGGGNPTTSFPASPYGYASPSLTPGACTQTQMLFSQPIERQQLTKTTRTVDIVHVANAINSNVLRVWEAGVEPILVNSCPLDCAREFFVARAAFTRASWPGSGPAWSGGPGARQ